MAVLNMLFENRRSKCEELGKKVPQAYRVYVEDTFLPYDKADARLFSKKPERIPLELEVKVFNINKSKGAEVLSRCRTLED